MKRVTIQSLINRLAELGVARYEIHRRARHHVNLNVPGVGGCESDATTVLGWINRTLAPQPQTGDSCDLR
jgi:hypothetical protein